MVLFMHLAAVILKTYFHNGPYFASLLMRATVRTVVAVCGGLVMAKLYYLAGPVLLGTVEGIAQEGDTSLCWTVMVLVLISMHSSLFYRYPFFKK
jgi:hypothetical protein